MMESTTGYALERLRGIKALSTLREGIRVQKSIPGLKRHVIRLLILNMVIFLLITMLLNGLFYYYLLNPAISWLFGSDGGFFASLGQWLLWATQLTVAAVFAFISLRLSVELSSIWHQQLVSRVIRFYRQVPEVSISFREWLKSLGSTIVEALKLCLMPLLILFGGLVPVIGLPLVYLLESHLLGRDAVMVYLDEIQTEERDELKKKLRWVPVQLGWLPMLLAFIPIAGWLMMPLVLILLVIGLASQLERSRTQ